MFSPLPCLGFCGSRARLLGGRTRPTPQPQYKPHMPAPSHRDLQVGVWLSAAVSQAFGEDRPDGDFSLL